MKIKKAFLLSFFLFLATQYILGDTINISRSSRTSGWPAIATNSKGEILVVWGERWGLGEELFYSIYKEDVDGEWRWSTPGNAQRRRESAEDFQLAVDSNDNFHLSWHDGHVSATRDIYYSSYDVSKGQWTPRERVYHSGGNSAWCRIDVDQDIVYVVWYHEHGGTWMADIILNSKPVGGTWPETHEDVSRNAAYTSIHPAFRAKDGNIYAIYMQNIRTASVEWQIFFNEKIDGEWQAGYQIGGTHWPAMEVDEFNNVHCFYPNKFGAMFYKSRINGKWSGQSPINKTYAPPGFGDIKYRDKTLVAAFAQRNPGTPSITSIFLGTRHFKEKWGGWEDPIKVGEARDAVFPKIALDKFGYAHVVWIDTIDTGFKDIYYERVLVRDPNAPFIEADQTSLSFERSGSTEIKIRNLGKGNANYKITKDQEWISVFPLRGILSDQWEAITVTIDASELKTGDYEGVVEVNVPEAINSPFQIKIDLAVSWPSIELSKSSISFEAVELGDNPDRQQFKIINAGGELLVYEISVDQDWLSVSETKGSLVSAEESDAIYVRVDISELVEGDYSGTVEISSEKADNSPQQMTIELTVLPPPIYAPRVFIVEKKENKSLFHRETMHDFTWEANPDNKKIEKYRIYEIDGVNTILIAELSASTFEYLRRHADGTKEYTYRLVAVDYRDRPGEPAEFVID